MANQFLKINNEFLKGRDKDDINIFRKIGTEGFTLYSYFLYVQGNNESANVSIKNIQSFLCRYYDKRPSLNYKNRQCKIGNLKSKQTILLYINALIKNKLITIHNLEDLITHYKKFESININETFIISCNAIPDEKYTLIPCNLFLNYIHKIGHIGWSLLSILSNLYNDSYGNKYSNGFANPSEEYLSKTINKGLTTVKAYLHLLEQLKLIKIEQQDNIYIETPHGTEVTYTPNHYITRWKLSDDKNYVSIGVEK